MLDPDAGGANSIEDAAARLVELLDELPAFDPCRGPIENWDPDVRQRRLPVWDLLPEHLRSLPSRELKDSWWAYGSGSLILVRLPSLQTTLMRAPGSLTAEKQPALQRVLLARATDPPESIRSSITSAWHQHFGPHAEPEVILRNDWHDRRALVTGVRDQVSQLVPLALRAITRALMDPKPVQALLKDDLLDYEVVDAAVAQLRGSMPQDAEPAAELKGNPPRLMTGREAAEAIGVAPATLSQWHKSTPAWAKKEKRLFKQLLEREGTKYERKSVFVLAAWYAAAEKGGLQAPTDCP